MANDTSWMDNLPEIIVHPAAGDVPAPKTKAPPPAPSKDEPWMNALPEVKDHPAAAPLEVPPPQPTYPIAGPTGDLSVDIPRRLGSAAADAAVGTVSPLLGHGRWSPTPPPMPPNAFTWAGPDMSAAMTNRPVGDTVREWWNRVKPNLGVALPQRAGGLISPDMANRNRQIAPETAEQARANAINTMGGTYYEPETAAGRVGQAALTGGIMGVTDPASIPAMIGGSATSEIARQWMPGHPLLASLFGFVPGAIGGKALGNFALPPGGGVRPSTISEQLPDVFPQSRGGLLDPGVAALARRMQELGIQLDPYQVSNSPFVKYGYSAGAKIPFSGAEAHAESQLGQVTRAVTNTFGENSDRLTPEVLQQAHQRLGNGFQTFGANASIPVDWTLMMRLQQAVRRAQGSLSADSVPAIRAQAANILRTGYNNRTNPGNIGGNAYLDLTAKGGPLDDMMQSPDRGIRLGGMWLREAVDDALQRNVAPDQVAAVRELRRQWKNMKTVEPLTVRADTVGGATPSTGIISPAGLRSVVNQSFGDGVVLQPLGANPLNDLARGSQRFLKEPQESGTTPRAMVGKAVEGGGKALLGGFGAYAAEQGQWKELAALLAGLVANRGAQEVMRMPGFVNRPVAAALNPQGFQFRYPWLLQALNAQGSPPPQGTQ